MSKTNSPSFYPAFLSLAGESALVIGGGAVAERKIRGLLKCGAQVTVVAPLATTRVQRWAARGQLRWQKRTFRLADLRGQRLVFCATDHPEVDERAAREARRRHLLVNCAAAPQLGNMILPAVAQAAPVQIAVSTGGASPALARRLARELELKLPHQAQPWADLLQKLRPQVLAKVPRGQREKLWRELTGDQMARLMRSGQHAAASRKAQQLIQQAAGSRATVKSR